jgi:hypothetical protein
MRCFLCDGYDDEAWVCFVIMGMIFDGITRFNGGEDIQLGRKGLKMGAAGPRSLTSRTALMMARRDGNTLVALH